MTNIENLTQIPGFKNCAATPDGKIYSTKYNWSDEIRELKQWANRLGYMQVGLTAFGIKRKTYNVHRLIAITFLGIPNGLQVNHKNGIKSDNRIDNLEYCTAGNNQRHAYANALKKPLKGECHNLSKLSNADVLHIREQYKNKKKLGSELALEFNVSKSLVSLIVNKKIWNHV